MNKRINRPEYLQKLIEFKDKDLVKIITGIRRCGKSTLLDLFEDYLLEQNIPKENILHMNMESLRYRNILNYDTFYDFVSNNIVEGEKNYLIFDELQTVKHWEKAIESFRLDYNVDIYITGSNAYLLSTEFSTLLSGRYVEIRLLPLSFKEFLTFYEFAADITMDEKFQMYLQIGGMPILCQFDFNIARINEALAYRNKTLPAAESSADKLIREAESYRESKINEAKGDVARFNAMYTEYAKNKDITRTRMYLETIEEILPGVKVYIDSSEGGVQKLLPLESFNTENGGEN